MPRHAAPLDVVESHECDSGYIVVTHAAATGSAGEQISREEPMNDVDTVGGYSVPVDPMDDLQCESCQ